MQTKQTHHSLKIKSNSITTFRINSNPPPTGPLSLFNLYLAIISILLCRPVTMTWHHKTSEAFRAIFWPNGNTITTRPGCGATNLRNEAEVKPNCSLSCCSPCVSVANLVLHVKSLDVLHPNILHFGLVICFTFGMSGSLGGKQAHKSYLFAVKQANKPVASRLCGCYFQSLIGQTLSSLHI